jgi:D-ribose pyranose/furanose isomerase RbsD
MPSTDYRPTVSEVGARMGARTLTVQGKREGDFSANTFPTAIAVNEIITDALSLVSSSVGEDVEEKYWGMAKAAVIAATAMEIEAGYYPETVSQTDSAYQSWKERLQTRLENIEKALNQRRPNERRIVSLRQETLVGIRGGRLDPWANELLP